MSQWRRPGRPSVPTPLLAAAAVLALGGAGWLFLAGGDEPAQPDSSATASDSDAPDRERAEGVLTLPDGESRGDERRRGQTGRERIDPDEAIPDRPDEPASSDDAPPAVLANLRGLRIALAAASAPGTGRQSRKVRVGRVTVACAGAADDDRLRVEDALLQLVETQLQQAGATVVRADEPAACVDERAQLLDEANLGLVVRLGDGDARVFAGHPSRGTAPAAESRTLAAELAAALDVAARTPATKLPERTLVTEAGAIDIVGGAPLALVELASTDADAPALAARSKAIVRTLAIVASRADVAGR